jgi:Ca2+-binding EF-hand superfamily protein
MGGWLAFGTSGACADAPAETAGDVQDLFFLGAAQPILVRFHIQIGERPLSAAWRDSVGKLYAYLDFDGDGTVRREEAERVEWPQLARLFGNPVRSPMPTAMANRALAPPAMPALDIRPQDGVVSVEELADFLQSLRGPLSVQTRPPSDFEKDLTFARIDANGDGTLAPDERDQAAQVLRRFDKNDDESISNTELTAFRNPVFAFSGQAAAVTEPSILLLDRNLSRIRMVQQVLNRFDTGGPDGANSKDHRLSRSEIGLSTEAFHEFDNDDDGTLDSDELMQFLDRGEPSVEMIVRLGPRPLKQYVVEFVDRQLVDRGKPGLKSVMKPHNLEVVDRPPQDPASKDSPRMRIRRTDDTLVTIEMGDVWIELRTEDMAGDAARARQIYESLFQNLDADKSESVSLAEVRGREPFQGLFRLMDRSGDGQVVKQEMNAALTLLDDLSRGHARGVLLFGNLDTSGDGRLGLRELRAVSERLASFDRNGDGQVTAGEIPHRFEWSLTQAPIPLGFVIRGNVNARMAGMPRPVATGGPSWFQKMDRNHDGDLSPREFLGPRDEYQRLDTNGDGLIDAVEARGAHTP